MSGNPPPLFPGHGNFSLLPGQSLWSSVFPSFLPLQGENRTIKTLVSFAKDETCRVTRAETPPFRESSAFALDPGYRDTPAQSTSVGAMRIGNNSGNSRVRIHPDFWITRLPDNDQRTGSIYLVTVRAGCKRGLVTREGRYRCRGRCWHGCYG